MGLGAIIRFEASSFLLPQYDDLQGVSPLWKWIILLEAKVILQ